MSNESIKLIAIGDVQSHRKDPKSLFGLVKDHFRGADLTICQLEATLSNKGAVRTDVRNPVHRVPPENVDALLSAGINIVSFAGNNNLDYGLEAFFDTIELLKRNNIMVVGAGKNLSEARSPVYLTAKDTTIAFVNFCSLLRDGYAATSSRGGISPLRVYTFYEPLENIYEQPGSPSRTITMMDHNDLKEALDSIKKAKEQSDIVVASFHWGVHFTHDLAIYQPDLAYAAIEAGADIVLGTHPHCLQAIDVYKGKYIFYSLGNFAFEQSNPIARKGVSEYLSFYNLHMDEELPEHPHPSHCRKTMITKFIIQNKAIESVSILPVYFNNNSLPEPLSRGSKMHTEIMGLMKDLCSEIGTELEERGDEAIVLPTKTHDIDTRKWVRDRKMSYPWLARLSTESKRA